ncbi:MAG: dihydrofolate reductase [Clostridia bacterium]|nr:dihydrofolate reductase [Clostridia bacterium]
MTAIVCVSKNWGIGKNNDLLFHIGSDLKRFRSLTLGQNIIMGRKTLESFPGGNPLPKRNNIVLSTTMEPRKGVTVVRSVDEAMEYMTEDSYLCGGEQIYRQLLPYCSRALVTVVDEEVESEHFFPNLDEMPGWKIESISEEMEEDGHRFRFIDYVNQPL